MSLTYMEPIASYEKDAQFYTLESNEIPPSYPTERVKDSSAVPVYYATNRNDITPDWGVGTLTSISFCSNLLVIVILLIVFLAISLIVFCIGGAVFVAFLSVLLTITDQ